MSSKLLAWYDTHKRDLPWRGSRDPYHIWVSEIMLQQTRVETVTPYFHRWLVAFPTLNALADADQQDVLKQWEGLGYYSRARNLHCAAKHVCENLSGNMPGTYAELRTLPGIGDYTAGAIASIAYGLRDPAVDGNVRRVLSRLLDLDAPTTSSLRNHAEGLVDPGRPGDFNQALMELGATVCTPRNPVCSTCPIGEFCLARANDTVHLRPNVKSRKAIPHLRVKTLLALWNGRVLISQRSTRGLLANMWEFPEVERVPRNAAVIGEVTHVFSHKRITYVVHHSSANRRARAHQRWAPFTDLCEYPMPAAQRKIEQLARNLVRCEND